MDAGQRLNHTPTKRGVLQLVVQTANVAMNAHERNIATYAIKR